MFSLFTNHRVKEAALQIIEKIDSHLSHVIQNEAIYDLFIPHSRYKTNIEDWLGSAFLCHVETYLLLQTGTMFKDVCAYMNKHLNQCIRDLIGECSKFEPQQSVELHKKLIALNNFTGWQDDMLKESRIRCNAWFMNKFEILTGDNYLARELLPVFINGELYEMEKDGERAVEIIRGSK